MDTASYPRILTVGGLPGTGTTTACRLLSDATGLVHVYTGQRFRDLAHEKGMTLAELGAYAETHPDVDRELDAWQARVLAQGRPVILEGRLAGFLAHRDRRAAYKAWFTCDESERVRRLVDREGGEPEAVRDEMRRREASEHMRYREFYGYDTDDHSVYDLVLDTTRLSREAVVRAVLDGYRAPARQARPAPGA